MSENENAQPVNGSQLTENIPEVVDPVNAIEIRAMEMRFEGFNMKEISEQLSLEYPETAPSYPLLRHWFADGRLKDKYRNYVKDQSAERRQWAQDMFKAHLGNAVRVLVQTMNKTRVDAVKVKASTEIINRELGETVKRFAGEVNDPAHEILRMAGLLDEPQTHNAEDTTQQRGDAEVDTD